MYAKLLSFAKNTAIGIGWLFIFLNLYRFIGLYRWRFDLLNGGHWHKVSYAWSHGWIVNTLEEWAFVIFVVGSIPLFLASWAIILQKNTWGKLLKKFKTFLKYAFPVHLVPKAVKAIKPKKEEKKLESVIIPVKVNGALPQEIALARSLGQAESYFTKAESPAEMPETLHPSEKPITPRHFEATHHTHAVREDASDPKIDAILARLDEAQKSKESHKVQDTKPSMALDSKLVRLFTEKGYTILENPKLSDLSFSFVALAKNRILLGSVLNQDTQWVADEDGLDGEGAMWTHTHGASPSPVQNLIAVRRQFQKEFVEDLGDQKIETLLCLTQGQIENLDDVKSKWRRENILVVNASKSAKTPFLKNLNDIISEKLEPASDELVQTFKKKLFV